MSPRAPLALLVAVLGVLLAAPPAAGGEPGWQWPVPGPVITGYSNGGNPYAAGQHRGIDIGAPVGTPVRAATGGRVRFAGVAGSSGLTVSVRSADGRYDTSYLHLSAVAVRKGDLVGAGKRLGAVGVTGRRSAVAPHLHFGVRQAGTRHAYLDPLALLPPPPAQGRRAPRPGGAPVPVPVPAVPSPERVRAPRRFPRPQGVRIPTPVRVPVARRVRVPRPGRPPLPVAPARVRAPEHVRIRRPVRGRAPARVPGAGPHPVPEAAPGRARAPSPRAHPAPDRSGGPDLGWALACAGLLLAAACLGRPGSTPERKGVARRRLPWAPGSHPR